MGWLDTGQMVLFKDSVMEEIAHNFWDDEPKHIDTVLFGNEYQYLFEYPSTGQKIWHNKMYVDKYNLKLTT
jgi:hypothetical protein